MRIAGQFTINAPAVNVWDVLATNQAFHVRHCNTKMCPAPPRVPAKSM